MDMSFLTEAIFSNVVYDLLKAGVSITAVTLREKLHNYRYKDENLIILADEINKISALEKKNEADLQKEFSTNLQIKEILSTIMLNPSPTTIVQTHTGTGHNIGGDYVAGDKVVHPKKE